MSDKPKRDWDAMQRELEKIEQTLPRFPGVGGGRYILNDQGNPVRARFSVWAVWFERYPEQRIVKQEWIGNVKVSTIFLGLDHAWNSKIPILWETMTFSTRKLFDQGQHRCSGGREQAEAMHAEVCAEVRKKLGVKMAKKK